MTTFVLVHGGLATEARVHACRRAHRRRLGRRARGAWWPPESGRDRVAFSTHNAHEGPEARN